MIKLSWINRYKWLAPSAQQLRGIIEAATGAAVDWSDANERNVLMYESAQPLAELYSPILDVDDTFVLQVSLWFVKVEIATAREKGGGEGRVSVLRGLRADSL